MASQSASTTPSQSPLTKQEAFAKKWLPNAEAYYNDLLTRSSEELWSTLATNDARRAFHLHDICGIEYFKHHEDFFSEFESSPDDRQLEIAKTWDRFCVQMEKLGEAINVLFFVWEAYKNGDMGFEKRQWYRKLPDDFRDFVEKFPKEKIGPAVKVGFWS